MNADGVDEKRWEEKRHSSRLSSSAKNKMLFKNLRHRTQCESASRYCHSVSGGTTVVSEPPRWHICLLRLVTRSERQRLHFQNIQHTHSHIYNTLNTCTRLPITWNVLTWWESSCRLVPTSGVRQGQECWTLVGQRSACSRWTSKHWSKRDGINTPHGLFSIGPSPTDINCNTHKSGCVQWRDYSVLMTSPIWSRGRAIGIPEETEWRKNEVKGREGRRGNEIKPVAAGWSVADTCPFLSVMWLCNPAITFFCKPIIN